MKRKALATILTFGAALGIAAPSWGKTVSINFYDSGSGVTTLNPTDVAGVAAAPRWNNVNRAGGSVIADTIDSREVVVGSGTFVDSLNVSTTIGMKWASTGSNTLELQSGGPTPDHTMMSGGGRTILGFNGNHYSQLELSGLLSEFAPGYTIYLYFGRGNSSNSGAGLCCGGGPGFYPNSDFQGGYGDVQVTSAGTYTATMADVPGGAIATAPFNTIEPTQFNGTYIQSTAQSVMGNYTVLNGLNLGTAVLTFAPVPGTGDEIWPNTFPAGFDTFNLVGLQIVGIEAVTVPEPGTLPVGLIGLAGLGLVALKKKLRLA